MGVSLGACLEGLVMKADSEGRTGPSAYDPKADRARRLVFNSSVERIAYARRRSRGPR
jgi:hypothetical protein